MPAGGAATKVRSVMRRVVGNGRLVFLACALSDSIAWSTSSFVASPTLTRMTRCVPPLRSRPRRIGSGLLDVGTTAALKPTSTARIRMIFHQRLRFKGFLRKRCRLTAIGCPTTDNPTTGNRDLFGRISRYDARNRRPRHPHSYVLGDFEVNDLRLNTLDGPVNPALGDHAISLFQRAQHLLRLAALLVGRRDDDEVKDEEDRRDGQDLDEESAGASGL